MRTSRTDRYRLAAVWAIGALAVATLGGCAGGPIVDPGPVSAVTGGPPPQTTASAADSSPWPSATDEPPRAMEVGDCLNKIAVDDLGLPIPEYIDCAEPHMFEVTALVKASKGDAAYNGDAISDARRDRCRTEYESYTGRIARAQGNAFGWDQLSEAARDAGEVDFVCYATAPGFNELTGSVAR